MLKFTARPISSRVDLTGKMLKKLNEFNGFTGSRVKTSMYVSALKLRRRTLSNCFSLAPRLFANQILFLSPLKPNKANRSERNRSEPSIYYWPAIVRHTLKNKTYLSPSRPILTYLDHKVFSGRLCLLPDRAGTAAPPTRTQPQLSGANRSY